MAMNSDIFSIESFAAFERKALDTFYMQATKCPPYAQYLALIGVEPESVNSIDEIPFMPISLFKSHDIYCGEQAPEKVFTSSSTTSMTPARHSMASLELYREAFTGAFTKFYGKPTKWSIYALLPSYLQREGSSLIYMVDELVSQCGSGGFYLDGYERLIGDMQRDEKPKILLGVTYALLDLAEQYAPKLHNTIVMETGGMKGRREEIAKSELHDILCRSFGVDAIHSEYGMAELTSQAYSKGGNIFHSPSWMRVVARDINDPFAKLPCGTRGALNIIDLANVSSCAFLQTDDIGVVASDGSFRVEGRVDSAEIRGCNLLVQ